MAASALAACSLYESSDRKKLEQNGYSLAGIQLTSCDSSARSDQEQLVLEDPRAWIFQNPDQPLAIRVQLKSLPDFSCRFQAESLSDLNTSVPTAVQETINESQKN